MPYKQTPGGISEAITKRGLLQEKKIGGLLKRYPEGIAAGIPGGMQVGTLKKSDEFLEKSLEGFVKESLQKLAEKSLEEFLVEPLEISCGNFEKSWRNLRGIQENF